MKKTSANIFGYTDNTFLTNSLIKKFSFPVIKFECHFKLHISSLTTLLIFHIHLSDHDKSDGIILNVFYFVACQDLKIA